MDYTIRLEQAPARPLAVVRRTAKPTDLPRVVPEACGLVWNTLRTAGVTGAGRHVALYRDNVIHLDIGVELDSPFTGTGEVLPAATPAGLVATTTHLGPYGRLHDAHSAIHRWCRANGLTLAGPSWEIYGHWKEEWNSDPSRIVTDVYYLLAERNG